MKTTAYCIIMVLLVGFVDPAGAEEMKVGWFKRTFCSLSWDEIKLVAKTPKAICSAVRAHVDYDYDFVDRWSGAREIWDKRRSDCQGFAACVEELCRAAGIEARTVIFYPRGSYEAHAVVVGKWQGKMWISSNGWYETVKSIEHAKKRVARHVGWGRREILAVSPEEVKGSALMIALGER